MKERLPAATAGAEFEPGDFETLFKKDSATVQLFIRNSDNRQALSAAFQRLIKDTNSVFQGFELVGDNALVKIRVSQTTNKGFASNRFYEALRSAQEGLKDSDRREHKDQPFFEFLLNLFKEVMSNTPKNDFRGSNFGGGFAEIVHGDQNTVQHVYSSDQKQSLAEAALEIQELLKQLEQTNPKATENEKIAYVNENATPALKKRAVAVLQAGSEAAIDEFLKNPYVNIGKAIRPLA